MATGKVKTDIWHQLRDKEQSFCWEEGNKNKLTLTI
jgi:hypothetical protein